MKTSVIFTLIKLNLLSNIFSTCIVKILAQILSGMAFLCLLYSPFLSAMSAKGKAYLGNPISNTEAHCLGEVDITFEQTSSGLFAYFQVSLGDELLIENSDAFLTILNAVLAGELTIPTSITSTDSVSSDEVAVDRREYLYRVPQLTSRGEINSFLNIAGSIYGHEYSRVGVVGPGGLRIINLYDHGYRFMGFVLSHSLQRNVGTLIMISLDNSGLVIVIGDQDDPVVDIRAFIEKHKKDRNDHDMDGGFSGGVIIN